MQIQEFEANPAHGMIDEEDWAPELTGSGLPNKIVDHVTIEEQGHRRSAKFETVFNRCRITVNDLQEFPLRTAPFLITSILKYVLDRVLGFVRPNKLVRIRIVSNSLTVSTWTLPIRKSQLTVDRWVSKVQKILYSLEEFGMDQSFFVDVDYTDLPKRRCVQNVPRRLKKKLKRMSSVVLTQNRNNLSMSQALVVGKAHADDAAIFYNLRQSAPSQTKITNQTFRLAFEGIRHS